MSEPKPEINVNFDLDEFLEIYSKFFKDAKNFALRCKKPDRKQFTDLVRACAMGFAIMGFTGCFVKLVCIPVNKFLME
jgi:protein transport protein SEC61 subunit gamma and related proteins